MDEQRTKDTLLLAMLPNVPFDGWSVTALRHAAHAAGISEAEAMALFESAGDMVAWFSGWADREMLTRLEALGLAQLRTSERIELAVRQRLAALEPHREAVRRSVAVLALPQNAALGMKLLYNTVDAMWYAAGDTATDWNFYTKRMLLAGVYASTTLYWLDDRSPGSADTEAFLRRRLRDVAQIPQVGQRLREIADALPNPLRFFNLARRR